MAWQKPQTPLHTEDQNQIKPVLHQLWVKQARKVKRFGQKTHHPSSIGGCLRKTALYWKYPNPSLVSSPVPTWEWSKRLGDRVHQEMQRDMEDSGAAILLPYWPDDGTTARKSKRRKRKDGLRFATEVPLNQHTLSKEKFEELTYYRMGGVIDQICEFQVLSFMEQKYPVIVDYKTTGSALFDSKWYHQNVLPKKLSEWEDQVMMYMHFSPLVNGEPVHTALVMVINLGDKDEMPELQFEYSPDKAKAILDRIEKANNLISLGEIPEINPKTAVQEYACDRFCGLYGKVCFPETGEVKGPK